MAAKQWSTQNCSIAVLAVKNLAYGVSDKRSSDELEGPPGLGVTYPHVKVCLLRVNRATPPLATTTTLTTMRA